MDRKKISVLVPCFNEEENVIPLAQELIKMFKESLSAYDYDRSCHPASHNPQ